MSGYHRPTLLEDGLSVLSENPTVVAGATDVYPGLTQHRGWGRTVIAPWLDISAIAELHGIYATGDHWRIGSMVTWSELIGESLPPAFDGLKSAAREVGGHQIQNRGTIAGNLCNASPAADGVPPLLCLDASVELASTDAMNLNDRRVVPLAEFLVGNRRTTRAPNELVTAILVPGVDENTTGHFYKLGARAYLVISIVMASVVVTISEQGEIGAIRIAVGACSEVAQRLTVLEQALVGVPADSDLAQRVTPEHTAFLTPINDIRADVTYRQHAALEVIQRLLRAVSASVEAVV